MKIILVGPKGSGKTSFAKRYVNNKFSTWEPSTVGYQQLQKHDDIIWDISDYDRLGYAFYQGADVILLCIDVNSPQAQAENDVEFHINKIREDSKSQAPILLVGTKSDAEPKKEKSSENTDNNIVDETTPLNQAKPEPKISSKTSHQIDIIALGKEKSVPAILTSSKEDKNVSEAIQQAKSLKNQKIESVSVSNNNTKSVSTILLQQTKENAHAIICSYFQVPVDLNEGKVREITNGLYDLVRKFDTDIAFLNQTHKTQMYQQLDTFLYAALDSRFKYAMNGERENELHGCQKEIKKHFDSFKEGNSKLLKQINSDPELTQQDRDGAWLAWNIAIGAICTLLFPIGIGVAIYNQVTTGNWCSFYKTTEKVDGIKEQLAAIQQTLVPQPR